MFDLIFVVEANPETYSSVVVELVAKRDVTVVEASVDDAVETKPLPNSNVVDVEFSPVPKVVNGNAKEEPPPVGQVVRHVSPVRQNVVTARVVEVAFVVVALTPVKFCRVVEPFNSKLERLVRPLIAVRVPVKLAALDMVCPFIKPLVRVVAVRLVIVPAVEKMFDVVAFTPVKFCRVVEEVTNRLLVVALPPSKFFATNADGTEPIVFLGDISPSQVGVTLSVPPTSTPK